MHTFWFRNSTVLCYKHYIFSTGYLCHSSTFWLEFLNRSSFHSGVFLSAEHRESALIARRALDDISLSLRPAFSSITMEGSSQLMLTRTQPLSHSSNPSGCLNNTLPNLTILLKIQHAFHLQSSLQSPSVHPSVKSTVVPSELLWFCMVTCTSVCL